MDIEYILNRPEEKITIGDIPCGLVFMRLGFAYMRLYCHFLEDDNAVALSTGYTYSFNDDEEVTLVDAKVIIE